MYIKQILSILDDIPNINRGGCGISTLAIYEAMKKYTSITGVKIIFLYLTYQTYAHKHNHSKTEHSINIPMIPAHICIKLNGEYIDSTGVISERKLNEYTIKKQIRTKKFLIKSINKGDWNPGFERHYIRDIENVLGISLKIKTAFAPYYLTFLT